MKVADNCSTVPLHRVNIVGKQAVSVSIVFISSTLFVNFLNLLKFCVAFVHLHKISTAATNFLSLFTVLKSSHTAFLNSAISAHGHGLHLPSTVFNSRE